MKKDNSGLILLLGLGGLIYFLYRSGGFNTIFSALGFDNSSSNGNGGGGGGYFPITPPDTPPVIPPLPLDPPGWVPPLPLDPQPGGGGVFPIPFYRIPNLKKDFYVPMTKTQQTFVKKIIPMIKATKTPGYTPNVKPVTVARRVTNIQLAKVRGLATQHLGSSYTKLISQIKSYKGTPTTNIKSKPIRTYPGVFFP